ncbi:MAG: glycosyltransferase [Ignavibacteriaceae bacterium]|jgi:glycosyltransferase involved in cell wall biosynthesis|nr:glycosyltransferase [Ignavibacteriaceae bacterium]
MQKKKIAIVGPAYPYRGGNSLFIAHLNDKLSEQFDVTILNYSLLYPSFLFPGTSQFDKSNVTLKAAISERIVNSISPLSWLKTAKRIKEINPDLVVFDWWHPFFSFCHFSISFLLGKKFQKKILFIAENFISHEGHFIDRLLTKIGLANASSFLSLSEKVEKDLIDISHNRKLYRSELPVYDCYDLTTNENKQHKSALPTGRKDFTFSEDDFVLLFFGYIRKYKGLDILLNAIPLLIKEIPNIKLLVVGESYDEFSFYENLVSELHLTNYVKMENRFVANEEVGKYYSVSDLVVLPYRSATQSGILNVAYGFNKPVLVTNVGGLAEFVDDKKTGIIVEPESPEAIANGIIEFCSLQKTVNFGKNIGERISHNQFSSIAQLFDKIITDSLL